MIMDREPTNDWGTPRYNEALGKLTAGIRDRDLRYLDYIVQLQRAARANSEAKGERTSGSPQS